MSCGEKCHLVRHCSFVLFSSIFQKFLFLEKNEIRYLKWQNFTNVLFWLEEHTEEYLSSYVCEDSFESAFYL